MIRHEAVRNYCESGLLGSTKKLVGHEVDGGAIYEDVATAIDTDRQGIVVKTCVRESLETRYRFVRHGPVTAGRRPT